MNYLTKTMKMMMVALAVMVTLGACNQQQSNKENNAGKKDAKTTAVDPNANVIVRYIDEDSILKNYNLAKDFQEMATRLQNEMDQAGKKYQSQLGNFESSMKQKYQNNQYNENSYNADMQKYQQMQQNAQTELSKLQQNVENQMMQSNKQLNDSVENFLKDYAAKNHYDVILKKAASLYINPDLDVTGEVIEGLNKRYTKVAKK